jgi:NADPH2:quinone reductase
VLVPSQAPDPVAGQGQVVVDVSVAAIDFVQTQLRRGFTPGPPLPDPPYVPGRSVAGLVSSVGGEVDPGWVGQRVVTHTASGHGGNAEQAVAAIEALIPVPEGVSLQEAAALLDDGSTALGLVEVARIRAGEWVLVEAAAGGVGSLLVQLVRAAGARVVGAARGRQKLDLATELGADAVVDYSEPGWPKRVRDATGGQGPAVVFDGVGGQIGREAFGVTARGGRFSLHGAASGAATAVDLVEAQQRQVRVLGIEQLQEFGTGAKARVEQVLAETAAGRIKPIIGQTFPLERADAAHAAIEAREVLGKTLLVI